MHYIGSHLIKSVEKDMVAIMVWEILLLTCFIYMRERYEVRYGCSSLVFITLMMVTFALYIVKK